MTTHLCGVLWDMDGTLIDSSEQHWVTWRDALAAENYTLRHEEFTELYGQRNDLFLRNCLGEDLDDREIDRISEAKETRYREMIRTDGISLLPGAEDWIRTLHAQGWRQAIATSAPRANLDVIVEVLKLDAFIGASVAAEDVQQGKPHPEVFLLAAERLGVPAERCVVVEDSRAGLEAGERAGMPTIAVQTTHDDVEGSHVTPRLDTLPPAIFEHLLANH